MSHGQYLTGCFLKLMLKHEFKEDHRPDWLQGLELDFFFPELSLAVEFQGDQHFVPTKFGDPDPQMQRDRQKQWLCKQYGVALVHVEAIDLEYTKMRRVLKKGLRLAKRKPKKILLQISRRRYGLLNGLAVAYRKTLVDSFNSMTARLRRGEPRKAAYRMAYKTQASADTTDIYIQFDGGCRGNPGDMYGSYEIRKLGEVLDRQLRIQFGFGTCNEAEYKAMIAGLTMLATIIPPTEPYRIILLTDSTTVRAGMNRDNTIPTQCPRRTAMNRLALEAKQILAPYHSWKAQWGRRVENVKTFGH